MDFEKSEQMLKFAQESDSEMDLKEAEEAPEQEHDEDDDDDDDNHGGLTELVNDIVEEIFKSPLGPSFNL